MTLGDRFKFEVLDDPKSFTSLDFSNLKSNFEDLAEDLRCFTAQTSIPSTPVDEDTPRPGSGKSPRYWNEYENGSEAGADVGFAIYINPDEDDSFFPEILVAAFTQPFSTIRSWFVHSPHPLDEEARTPLLGVETSSMSYAATLAATPSQDSEDEDSTSGDDFPYGYQTHYASLPSVNEQRLDRFRNIALSRALWGLFFIASVLLAVAGILISTGRHKLMAQVDAGVAIGVATALVCTFIGLALFFLRTDKANWLERGFVFVWFALLCSGSGALLVQVADSLS